MVVTATAGGLASVAGGGKFGNGAVTAAFGYLYNELGTNRQRGYKADLPQNWPAGVDIWKNASLAEDFAVLTGPYPAGFAGDVAFYNRVRNRGPWDYKQLNPALYEDFGNFHFGFVGAAAGYSLGTLLRMAGWAQVRGGNQVGVRGQATSIWQAYKGVGGRAPFQDDWNDQYWIRQGHDYYKQKK